jgi:hypothetical protein
MRGGRLVMFYTWEAQMQTQPKEANMSFGLYILGFIILIVGLALGAHLMHIPDRWIGVGVVVMIGIGIITGVTSTRRPDPS